MDLQTLCFSCTQALMAGQNITLSLQAAEKTPRDPLEIEELWDQANEQCGSAVCGPDAHEVFARLLERAHGIGA